MSNIYTFSSKLLTSRLHLLPLCYWTRCVFCQRSQGPWLVMRSKTGADSICQNQSIDVFKLFWGLLPVMLFDADEGFRIQNKTWLQTDQTKKICWTAKASKLHTHRPKQCSPFEWLEDSFNLFKSLLLCKRHTVCSLVLFCFLFFRKNVCVN